ncbi:MAG: SulP family inorganic anion transporter [Deltaproteobacteria bacterium]|nr:SulP family inorganic anion transporter [Myxococcales bacterium]MDP3220445.1 SulP family inorganic anion transporter [Deltaproteobacteria bacterium]
MHPSTPPKAPAGTLAHPPAALLSGDEPPPLADVREHSPFKSLKYDLPAALVVFLVALPLCLGIALASGAPLLSGLIAGCVGGLVIPLISRSPLSVSGPAAGLAAIVLAGIHKIGSFRAFCAIVLAAGVLQGALGLLRAGQIVSFIPLSVIRGMLAAIGLLLILKQTPHAVGYDAETFWSVSFEVAGEGNTFTLLLRALSRLEWSAVLVSAVSLAILVTVPRTRLARVTWLPGPLLVVVAATLINAALLRWAPGLALEARHLVAVPSGGPAELFRELRFPDFSALLRAEAWPLVVTIAVVASLESLLSVQAIDKLDPFKRKSPPNRELIAQGVANALSGLIGGLPITAVIVRSSANLNAGGHTQASAFVHGLLLLVAVLFLGPLLNRIPLAALATILIVTGYKLATPTLFRQMYRRGQVQFLPFVLTVVAILFTDLLKGVVAGIVVGVAFTVRNSMSGALSVVDEGGTRTVRFQKDIYFFHRPALIEALESTPKGYRLVVDRGGADYVEDDALEILHDLEETARSKGIELELRNVEAKPGVGAH